MSTQTASLAMSNSTDALFRAWASAITAALTAFGWVQTADTGQADLTTQTKPTANDQETCYQIWRTDDGDTDWYMKISFGSGTGSTDNPGIYITMGTSTNGAGTITGQVGTKFLIKADMSNTTPVTCYFSGDTARFGMSMWPSYAQPLGFWVDKDKNDDGSDSDVGIHAVSADRDDCYTQFIPKTGAFAAAFNGTTNILSAARPPSSATSGVVGSDVGVYPIQPFFGICRNPALFLCFYFHGDRTALTEETVLILGSTHNLLFLGNVYAVESAPTLRLAMRYE